MKQTKFAKIAPKVIVSDVPMAEFTQRQESPKGPTDIFGFKLPTIGTKQDDKLTLNARIEKWRKMISNLQRQDKKVIKSRVRKGVPNGIRSLVWPLLGSVDDMKADLCVRQDCAGYQQCLNKSEYQYEHQIKLDVLRTFPNNVNFQDKTACTESLINVLKALSVAYPQLGYCQGMNFLTASLIIVNNDENAFWLLYSLMVKYKQAEKYMDPIKIYREFYILDALMKIYHNNLYKICKKNQIDLFYFATEWFITMFSSILPMNIFYRVFEIFLIEGEKTLFRCALTILHFKEETVLSLHSFEDQLKELKNTNSLQQINEDAFIKTMISKYTFSMSLIKSLDKEYTNKK